MLPDWTGRAAIVAASGPSTPDILKQVRGLLPVIVINRTFEIAPWADILYAADSGFWAHYREAHKFQGLKLAPDKICQHYCTTIQLVKIAVREGRRVDELLCDSPGVIGGGGHSGFQALNIALQTGAHPIYLAGYDYLPTHWHPDHPNSLRNPENEQLKRWRELMNKQAPALAGRVYNLSEISTLKGFEHERCCSLCKTLATLSA